MEQKLSKGQRTREHIVATAAQLFAGDGYEATSIETVLARTGLSRGALYHHFASKQALYTAVLEAVEARIAATTRAAARGITDPLEALRAGCNAWIDLGRDPEVRQIVLLDAPAVIGWQAWREIDARHGFGQLKAGLAAAARADRLKPELVESMAHVLLAALLELALLIARAADPVAETRSARATLQELFDRLFAPRPPG